MPPPRSTTYERLRDYIAKRMRMSPIDQPLMLLEQLSRRSPAPAKDVARRILGRAWWARFTFNGITRYGNGATSLIGGDELSDSERDELLQLCRQRLDGFRAQRGEEVFAHRSRHRTPISGSATCRPSASAAMAASAKLFANARALKKATLQVHPLFAQHLGGFWPASQVQEIRPSGLVQQWCARLDA